MTNKLESLRALLDKMKAEYAAYSRADEYELHIHHANLRAARFKYNTACGEYVAEILERE